MVLALFVTLLWSSSWVLIKWGLVDIAPCRSRACATPWRPCCWRPSPSTPANRRRLAECGRNLWLLLIGFGLLQYG